MAAVWPNRVVEDGNLTLQISALRRILDRGRSEGSCIQTVAGRGYRFAAAVTWVEAAFPAAAAISRGSTGSVPRLSIAVLPFTNLSSDPEQEYFADGITDDLTTDLSRIAGSFVIACSTAFTYKGKPVDVKQVGRELGVRYVLEGSVRRSGSRVRMNVQLIDAQTGGHLWAERFDIARQNLAEAEDEIIGRLARTLNLELVEAVGRRIEQERATDPDTHDLAMRGWALFYRPRAAATLQDARRRLRAGAGTRAGFHRRKDRAGDGPGSIDNRGVEHLFSRGPAARRRIARRSLCARCERRDCASRDGHAAPQSEPLDRSAHRGRNSGRARSQ